jgi:hypothetical protein
LGYRESDPIVTKVVTTKSEILKDENLPMGNIVSERASRPLISEKSPEVRKETVQQIENSAEEKNDRG